MKYFTIEELCRSAQADKSGINNSPSQEVQERLETLVDCVLDPLREAWGKPIIVNSGYRCSMLNTIVGGARNSQHLRGEAADITTGTREGNRWIFDYIKNNLPYDQLIDEYDYRWVHVSYRADGGNRQQVLRQR